MRKAGFFPKMALANLIRNGKFTFPHLLTVIGTAASFYILCALAGAGDLPVMTRYVYLSAFMSIGVFVIGLFAVIFLTYTNGFIMKRRKRELGLYHILGLEKRHIAAMLGMETLYTAAAGITGGILAGLLLQKLATLLLHKILHMDAMFGFYVSGEAITSTATFFGAILLFHLALNLFRMGRQSPVEMLREQNAGEREPKTNWPCAVLGILCLGGGYGIALFTRSAVDALAFYFPAVFLVIIGTYCLFSAVSIVILKGMRKKKNYYYQTNHFINVSGMLYRMRRNATGLANICILSTMVLVMVSGTLALYLGSEKTLEKNFPGNVGIEVRFDPLADAPFDPAAFSALVKDTLAQEGHPSRPACGFESVSFYAVPTEKGYDWQSFYQNGAESLNFISAEDYAMICGQEPGEFSPTLFQFTNADSAGTARITVNVKAVSDEIPKSGKAILSPVVDQWIVVEDSAALRAIQNAQLEAGGEQTIDWTGFWNVEGTEAEMAALPRALETDLLSGEPDRFGAWTRIEVNTREDFTRDYYSINGGFFFLGLFLGLLFILAATLIIYYKQISEGYEDRERYVIMQKVGMEQAMVRKSVNSQILVVFFAPLLAAAIHVAFDFRLIVRLLTLFGLHDPATAWLCTAAVFLVFAVLYALVYRATAKLYYKMWLSL